MLISGSWDSCSALLYGCAPRSGLWFPRSQGLAGSLSPQVISMVMVSIGVYARLMKHAGEL